MSRRYTTRELERYVKELSADFTFGALARDLKESRELLYALSAAGERAYMLEDFLGDVNDILGEDRAVECLRCQGHGAVCPEDDLDGNHEDVPCHLCEGDGCLPAWKVKERAGERG